MKLDREFENITLEQIDNYVNCRQEEHLHLEFKVINKSDFSHRDDRKNFAKAVSGFANSDGGIIVWGIEANSKNDEGIDCANNKQELDHASLFLSKLNEFTGQASTPIVDGIRHKIISTEGKKGFVATLIPSSDSGPFMGKLGEDRYYKRSGDSFYKMEHFDLEDMFGRRRKPSLELEINFNQVSKIRDEIRLFLLITINNVGRGSAKSPFLSLSLESGLREQQFGVDGNGNRGLKWASHSKNNRILKFGGNQDIVLHPSVSLDVTKLQKNYPSNNPKFEDLEIQYDLAAEGINIYQGCILLDAKSISEFITSKIGLL
jgi:hypothetical protein